VIGMTLCSGIGAPEVAAPWVDWRFASEIENFPRAVLKHRLGYVEPEDHNQGDPLLWGDMTEVTPDLLRARGVPLPDLLVAGTPCQAFSVAGARKGLEDPRGNLTLAFVEICHAIVAARPDGKLAVVWENVPGVLSDNGNAFGCFLGGLVGAVDALRAPGDGSWPGEGMVQGPRARAAWAVLDAQWFGVAQRRRRVFVVVDFGGCCDPAAVLLEPDSLRGDRPSRGEAGKGAPTLPARSTGGGGLGTDFDLDGGLGPSLMSSTGSVAHCLNAGGMGRIDYETETMVAHSLRGEGFDASEDGTGRATPLVPVAFDTTQITSAGNYSRPVPGDTGHPLAAGAHPPAVAFDCKGTEVQTDESGVSPPLRSMGHLQSHQNAGGHAAVAFDLRGREHGAQLESVGETVSLRAADGGSSRSYVGTPWAVRRLTPRECERLQGFGDDYTSIPFGARKKIEASELLYIRLTRPDLPMEEARRLAADGPRYKALGNSMAVPVMKWILDRVQISMGAA